MKIEPIVVVDVKCTGTDKSKAQLLQLSMVMVDDLLKPNEEYDQLNMFVKHEQLQYIEPKSLQNITYILSKATEENTMHVVEIRLKVLDFLAKVAKKTGNKKVILAGKNVATFDLEILKTNGVHTPYISHRIFDVGSMYFQDFGYIPSLNEISTKLGKTETQTDALQDCYDVIDALKAKCVIK